MFTVIVLFNFSLREKRFSYLLLLLTEYSSLSIACKTISVSANLRNDCDDESMMNDYYDERIGVCTQRPWVRHPAEAFFTFKVALVPKRILSFSLHFSGQLSTLDNKKRCIIFMHIPKIAILIIV